MNDEEKSETAVQQRAESNFLTGQLVAIGKQLRIMGVIGIVTAIGVGVQDHYLLWDTAKDVSKNSGRLDIVESVISDIPKPSSRWSFGMMTDWVRQFAFANPAASVPVAKEIHDTHVQDL